MTRPTATPLAANILAAAEQASGSTMESATSAYFVVTLHYLENSPILVRGTVTGRRYAFSGAQPDQSVDARDAKALLRTPFFRRGD